METENKNIHVMEVDMENRPPEDIARDAVLRIAALFDYLEEEQKKQNENRLFTEINGYA